MVHSSPDICQPTGSGGTYAETRDFPGLGTVIFGKKVMHCLLISKTSIFVFFPPLLKMFFKLTEKLIIVHNWETF